MSVENMSPPPPPGVSEVAHREPAGPADGGGAPHARSRGPRLRFPEIGALLIVLIGLCIYFSVSSPYFLSRGNFVSILEASAITGIIAVPGTMLLVAGQFDLSVGSGTAFCGVVMALLISDHGTLTAVLVALAAGLVIGAVNGFLVTVVGVNALITTLGMLAVLRGLAQVLADGQTVSFGGFDWLGTGRPFLDVPVPVDVLIILAVLAGLMMRFTVFGRSLYAIGSNRSPPASPASAPGPS
jgi:ribose transport system permease protein